MRARFFARAVVLLTQLIEGEGLIAERRGYRRLTASKALAPSLGPKPMTSGGGASRRAERVRRASSVIEWLRR